MRWRGEGEKERGEEEKEVRGGRGGEGDEQLEMRGEKERGEEGKVMRERLEKEIRGGKGGGRGREGRGRPVYLLVTALISGVYACGAGYVHLCQSITLHAHDV